MLKILYLLLENYTIKNDVKAKFTATGEQNVILYPLDKTIIPKVKGITMSKVVNSDGNSQTLCTEDFPIKVGFPDVNVLLVHDESKYETNTLNTSRFLQEGSRFGENGSRLETGKITVTRIGLKNEPSMNPSDKNYEADLAKRKTLIELLNKNIYDIIIFDGARIFTHSLDANVLKALEPHFNNTDTWVFIPSEMQSYTTSDINLFRDLMDKNGGSTGTWLKNLTNAGKEIKSQTIYDGKGTGYAVLTKNSYFTLNTKFYSVEGGGVMWASSSTMINDLTGSNYEALVTMNKGGNLLTNSTVIMHKTKKIIIFPVFNYSFSREYISRVTSSGDIPAPYFLNGFTARNKEFVADLLISILEYRNNN